MSDGLQPEVDVLHHWADDDDDTNLLESRYIKREKASLPVDVRGSKTFLLKLPNAGVVRQPDAGKCYHVTHHY